MRKFRYLFVLAALLGTTSLYAQEWNPSLPPTRDNVRYVDKDDDVQARLRAAIEIPVFKNFSVEVSEQVRLKDTFGQVDKFVTSVGVGYKPWKFLKFGVDYSFVNERTIDTEQVERMVHVRPIATVVREDVAKKLFTRDDLQKGAPETMDGYWQVPRVVE